MNEKTFFGVALSGIINLFWMRQQQDKLKDKGNCLMSSAKNK
jgi:hypothetical protein